jgi:short-subunit dehydrogenase
MGSNKKVILITGGSSGIGKSMENFYIIKDLLFFLVQVKAGTYFRFCFPLIALDVRDLFYSRCCIQSDIAGRIDVVVNNAGVGITGPLEEIPVIEMKKSFDTNFGPIEVMKFVYTCAKQQSGLIINTSIAGYMGLPYRSLYSSKVRWN